MLEVGVGSPRVYVGACEPEAKGITVRHAVRNFYFALHVVVVVLVELHRVLERHIVRQPQAHCQGIWGRCDRIEPFEGLQRDLGVVVQAVYRYVRSSDQKGVVYLIYLNYELPSHCKFLIECQHKDMRSQDLEAVHSWSGINCNRTRSVGRRFY